MTRIDWAAALETDRQRLWHPYAGMYPPPEVLFAAGGHGTRLVLADGSELIDALSSWWCVCHGHGRAEILSAIQEQSAKLAEVMFAGFTHAPAIRLAEALTAMTPPGLEKVFFSDSGSVAVECALKMAIQYQYALKRGRRNRFATVYGGYHGDTTGAMGVSDPGGMHEIFSGVITPAYFAPRPATAFDAPWDDFDFAAMRELLYQHRDELAAVIIEPIFQGANAMRFYHPEYLRRLRQACDEFDLLLICDEIATGFGRTGKLFAVEYADIAPDILCVGKGLTGGAITLAATVATAAVARTISTGAPGGLLHGPTFMANPLACAAGAASLALFGQYDWSGAVKRIETQLRRELEPLRGLPGVRDVRVLGAIGVVELAKLPDAQTVAQTVRETGVWLRPFGHWVYTMPPYITAPEEITRIAAAMARLCRA